MVIQTRLLNARAVYTKLETWRVDLAEQVAGAVSARAHLPQTSQTVTARVRQNSRARCGTEACLHVRRLHPDQAQHQKDLTTMVYLMLL
jgi:hypothetical protein